MEKTTTRKIRIYSERKIRAWMWYFSIPLMLFVFLRLIIKDAESWLLLLIWPIMLGLISFLSSKIGKLLDHYLWIFEKDKIIRKMWNHTQSYSYLDVIHALQKNPLKVTKNGYVVPLPDREIHFFYDMDIVRQRHLLAAYRYLIKQIEEEIPDLPDMSKILIEEMDQRQYYRKKRKNYGIAALGFSFILSVVMNSAVEMDTALIGLLAIGVQYFSLWEIFRGIYFGKKVEEKIEKRFVKNPGIKLYLQRISYWYLIWMGILTVGCNLFWIWF